MDESPPSRPTLSTTILSTLAIGLAGMVVFWLVADIALVPKVPPALPAAHRSFTEVGGPGTSTGRSVVQLIPPPSAGRTIRTVAVSVGQASGPTDAALDVLVFEMPSNSKAGPGTVVARGSVARDALTGGVVELPLDLAVHARPGHWYALLFQTDEPGMRVTLDTLAAEISTDTPLWQTTGLHVSGNLVVGSAPWTAVEGSRLLFFLDS
jgi:hypothetical protein